MKKLFGFLCKKCECANAPTKVYAFGVSAEEYAKAYRTIDAELGKAANRQKIGAKVPSAYMKGLQYALDVLKTVKPHDLEVLL